MQNTIFDDVFRTMIEKMPYLAIPLINEVFHTSYPEDIEIIQLRNEHQEEDGETITDSCLKIGRKLYHIECQSTDDTTMAVRMIQYDFYIAMDHKVKDGRRYRIEFPKSCVLYLRSGSNIPEFLEVDVVFADEVVHSYRIPSIKVEDYTKDVIFEKNLLLLLPFYIMRYEKDAKALNEEPAKLNILLEEYEDIRLQLEKDLQDEEKIGLYTDLVQLIIKISDYIFRKEEVVRKGIGKIMGGRVLELESERLIRKGINQGISQGISQGEEKLSVLINRLIIDNRSDEIKIAVTDKEARERFYDEYGM